MNSSSVFDVSQLNLIRDALTAWCAEHSVDPQSPLGQEAGAFLLKAYGADCRTIQDLVGALDAHIAERESHVRIGSPEIPSKDGRAID